MSQNKQRDFLDLTSLQLKAKPPEGANRPAGLTIKTWNNKVSMTVFSNVQSLPRYGIFGVNMYPYVFSMFLAGFTEVLDMPLNGEKITRKIRLYDKPTQDKKHTGDLVYGRDQEGVPYVCVISPQADFPKIVFRLEPPRNIELADSDRSEAARLYAKGFVDFWRESMNRYLMDNFVDESNNSGGKGGYGGGNRNNNGGGNKGGYGGASSNLSDDDLPFD